MALAGEAPATVYRDHAVAVRSATEDAVRAQWQRSQARVAETEALMDGGHSIQAILVGHPQPVLLTLVLGILMEVDPDEEDGLLADPDPERLELDDGEFWHLLAVMHTVVAVLDSHATYELVA